MESMTGYALVKVPLKESGFSAQIQLKSVNHRGFEVKFWLAASFLPLENEFRQILQEFFIRGFFEVRVVLCESRRGKADLQVRWLKDAFEVYRKALIELDLPVSEQTLSLWALHMPGVWQNVTETSQETCLEKHRQPLIKGFRQACSQLKRSRTQEGRFLAKVFRQGLRNLEKNWEKLTQGWLKVREDRTLAQRYWKPIWEMWESLSYQDVAARVNFDENKGWLAWWQKLEKHCIQEELDRLKSHHEAIWKLIESNPSELGRQLDFYLTECLREWNTLSQKALLPEWTQLAIDSKAWVEKLRQQVQNVQ